MRITIRLDDITPDMDWAKFERFRALLERYRVRPLIGVVPDAQDAALCRNTPRADFWAWVRNMQGRGWTVAMHGLHHRYHTRRGGLFPLNRQSEFAGLPLAEQRRMLREGRRILASHGIETDIFMAPAHSYDRKTLRALKENGFYRMTDGFGGRPYRWRGMTFYPISFDRKKSLASKTNGITTFVVHTNTLDKKDFVYYENLFRTAEFADYAEYFSIPALKRSFPARLKEYWMARIKRAAMRMRRRKEGG